jgi:AcrR family transcriptional regulator
MAEATRTAQRREHVKEALVAAAEQAIESHGLRGLHARDLAQSVGCAVGAIYNVVEDLDDLTLLVNARTLAALERKLDAAGRDDTKGRERAIDRLVRLALAYLDFAAKNTQRWRALFDHRLPAGRGVPDWYVKDQQRLFDHVEEPLHELSREASAARRAMLARSLFSAVHGLVVLGLEEKLQVIPLPQLREQMTFLVTTIGRGLTARE